jgi:hypothetical protein
MFRKLTAMLALFAMLLPADLASARGGRGGGGGGGRGGGGMSRGGGGGGMSRPSGGGSRAPSMSRSAPRPSGQRPSSANLSRPNAGSMNRPSAGNMNRPNAGNMNRPSAGNMNRPNAGNLNRPNAGNLNRPSTGLSNRANAGSFDRAGGGQLSSGRNAFQSQRNFERPTQGQLNDFLDLPAQSGGAGNFSGNRANAGSRSADGDLGGSKSFTTEGGSTITVGAGGGSVQTPGGATIGGAGAGIKVEGAGGNTFVKGSGAIGATDGTNSAIAAGSATGVRGAGGNSAANVRGGYADTAGNRAIGGVTGVQGRNGYAAVNARGARTNGDFTQAGGASAIRGPAGNTIAGGRGAAFHDGQFVGGNTWGAVNGNFTHWNSFGPGWHNNYPGAWWPGKWALATTAWATATWWVAGGYCGCYGEPVYYDYGDTVYSDGENVYYEDQPVATNEEYYQQVDQLASAGAEATDDSWLPLGVFGIVAEGETQAVKLLQLAVNKSGQVRGNYEDTTTNEVLPVIGSVDKETQRVAIKLEGNDKFLLETGLYNLTNDEAPALLYAGQNQPETRTLVRLQEPTGDATASATAAPQP